LVGTPAYEHSRRARYKIEALFAEFKQRIRLGRVRLRRLWNVGEQFLLAATAQNIKRLVRFLAQQPPTLETQIGWCDVDQRRNVENKNTTPEDQTNLLRKSSTGRKSVVG